MLAKAVAPTSVLLSASLSPSHIAIRPQSTPTSLRFRYQQVPHETRLSTSSLLFSAASKNLSQLFNAPYGTRRRRRRHFPAAVRSLFTGIVEEMGTIRRVGPLPPDGGFSMTISAATVLSGVQLGDSISVNGTCLTVSSFDLSSSQFTVGLSPETLRRTYLGDLVVGSPVNLERAVQPISRMGGHFVQGHVDGTGEIVAVRSEGDSLWVKVRASPEVLRFLVPKGFISVDGTSLTVVGVYDEESCFDFMLVAYTQQKVVIPLKKVGDKVNLEVDILGKYVDKLLHSEFKLSASA